MQWRRRHQHQWVIGSAQRSLLIRQSCLSSAGEGGASDQDERDHSAGEGNDNDRPASTNTPHFEHRDAPRFSWKAERKGGAGEGGRATRPRPIDRNEDGFVLPPEAQYPQYPCGHPLYPRFYYPSMPATRYRPLQSLDWFNPRVPANCQVYYTLSHPRYDGLRAVPATAVQNAYWWPFNPGVYTPCTLAPAPEPAMATETTEPSLAPQAVPYVYPGYAYGPAVLTQTPSYVSCRPPPPVETPQVERTPKKKRKRKRKAKVAADNGRDEEDEDDSGSCCTTVTGDETATSSVEDLNQPTRGSANGVRGDMEPLPSGASGGVASLSALAKRIVQQAVKEAQEDVCRTGELVTVRDDVIVVPGTSAIASSEGGAAAIVNNISDSTVNMTITEGLVNDQPMPCQDRPSRDFPPLPLVNNVFAATLVDDIVSGALGVVKYLESRESKDIPEGVPAVPQPESILLPTEIQSSPSSHVEVELPANSAFPSFEVSLQDIRDVPSEENPTSPSEINAWSERNGFLEEEGSGQGGTELHTEIVFISETSFMDEETSRAAGLPHTPEVDDDENSLNPEQDKILNPDAPAFIPGDSWTSAASETDLPVHWSEDEDEEAGSLPERGSMTSVSDSLKATTSLFNAVEEGSLNNAVPKFEFGNTQNGEKTESAPQPEASECQNDTIQVPEEESGILDMAEELEEELGAAARTLENYNPVRYKDYYQICSSVDVPDSPLELSSGVVTRQPSRPSGPPLSNPTPPVPQRPFLATPVFPMGNHGEIVVHEVEDGASECGSEDVDTVGHTYEALTSDESKKHLYVNQLSLAAELLHTHQNLPYDADFKPLVSELGSVSSEVPSTGHTNREVLDHYYGHRTLMEMQEMTNLARGSREVSDSGVQSEESSDETDDINKARRQHRGPTQSSAARQPLSAVLKGKSDPLCLCCNVM